MTASPPRRALRGLLGTDPGHLTESPARHEYSVARRVVAGLLGVRLTAPVDLASVLPPVISTSPAPVASTSPGTDRHPSAEAAIAAADPVVRLTVRQSPLAAAVLIAGLLLRAVDLADYLMRHIRGSDQEATGIPSHVLADVLALDLAGARPLVLDRAAFDFNDALDLTLNSTNAITRNLARASITALGLARYLAQDGDGPHNHLVARDLAGALADALASALPYDPSLTHARYLARSCAANLTRDLHRTSDLDFGLSSGHARELASVLAAALSESLGIGHVDGLADALLGGALDDFSQADLSEADLTHISLVGVRWSARGTRWAPGVDVEALIGQSKETDLGSGIYVIMRRGETELTREEAQV